MSTLQELVRFCNEKKHFGALLLTGEWGCGKTYLIDRDLTDALRSTHFIVRVSFLGVDSLEALNSAVRNQYLMVCTPFLGKLKHERERHKSNAGFFEALSNVLLSLNPLKGSIASAIVAVDPLEYIPLEPVVEDVHDKGVKKRVVLVFDDLNRSQLDWGKFVGTINEYCENKGFTTIVIGDVEAMKATTKNDIMLYKTVKEKTIAHTVKYIPDYQEIIKKILAETEWPSQEYADFLAENEQTIYDAFCGDSPCRESGIKRYHNLRSLNCALREFYSVYEVLTKLQTPDIRQYFYSFIVYMLVSRNGINKEGLPDFGSDEELIRQLYPGYSSEYLPEGILQWIEDGILDADKISGDVSDRHEKEDMS